ncbi:MAG: hypothetical protein DCC65_16990 [Planctomycetota bacterium]|nr:MAG: hypothetical protein DCC65_16990 [Planctomycetota bacterium]
MASPTPSVIALIASLVGRFLETAGRNRPPARNASYPFRRGACSAENSGHAERRRPGRPL